MCTVSDLQGGGGGPALLALPDRRRGQVEGVARQERRPRRPAAAQHRARPGPQLSRVRAPHALAGKVLATHQADPTDGGGVEGAGVGVVDWLALPAR